MEEIWKTLPGYEGYYEVSSVGRVRSLSRVIEKTKTVNGKQYKYLLNHNGRIMFRFIRSGYMSVMLSKDCIKKYLKISQAVAMAFLGHTPNGFNAVVDHIDGNKLNDNVENLRVISNRENTQYYHLGTNKSSKLAGVHKYGDRYKSNIQFNRKRYALGTFDSEVEAGKRYQIALEKIKDGTFLTWRLTVIKNQGGSMEYRSHCQSENVPTPYARKNRIKNKQII